MVRYYFKPKNYIHRNNLYQVIYAHCLRRQFNSPKKIFLYNVISRNFSCGYNKPRDNIKRLILVHKTGFFLVCLQQFNNIARYLYVSK